MRRSVVLTILALALCCATAALAAPDRSSGIGGTWLGSYSGPYSGHFTLKWKLTGSILTGTIKLSSPAGTYGIGGSITRNKIKFGAVKVGATYTGQVFGSKMSGTWKSRSRSGAVIGGSWSATKISRG